MSQAVPNVHNPEGAEKTRSRQNNRARLAGMIFLLLVIGTLLFGGMTVLKWMNDVSRLPLSKLVVTGQLHYTTFDDLRQAVLSLGAPGSFMSQDVNIIQQQIERLPWVKQASIRKQWPNELKVHLVEYFPVARWNDTHRVDAAGKAFAIPDGFMGQEILPMLYGPEGSEWEVLDGYHTISQTLTASQFKVKMVVMTARHSWQLEMHDDIRIELGRNNKIQRLQRLIELYPILQQQAQTDNKRINYIDLRYDTGAAVGWTAIPRDPQDDNQQKNQTQVKQQ